MKFNLFNICVATLAACAMMSSCTQLEDTNYNSVIADGFKPTDLTALVGLCLLAQDDASVEWCGKSGNALHR